MRPVIKNARTSSACNKSVKGFTLIELLLSTILGGILMSAVAFTFANMAGSFAEQPTTGQTMDWDANNDGTAGNDAIPYSPAYSQLPAAFSLQAEISDALQSTKNAAGGMTSRSGGSPVSAIFVISSDEKDSLGNTQSLPAVPAGDADDVATIPAITNVASKQLASSLQFYDLLKPATSGQGFSLYFISGTDNVNMSVHCRVTVPVEGTTIYTVKTYSNGKFCPTLSYAFGVKNTNSSVNPSARCIKLRSNDDWGIDEDVGTQVIFPDPSVIAYQMLVGDDAAVRTYSRFAVLLPIKP